MLAYIICNKVICILKTNLLDDRMHKLMFITPFFMLLFSFFINLTYIRANLRRARTPSVMASRLYQQRRHGTVANPDAIDNGTIATPTTPLHWGDEVGWRLRAIPSTTTPCVVLHRKASGSNVAPSTSSTTRFWQRQRRTVVFYEYSITYFLPLQRMGPP